MAVPGSDGDTTRFLILYYTIVVLESAQSIQLLRKTMKVAVLLLLLSFVCLSCRAQCANDMSSCMQGVPRFVKLNGTLKNITGVPPSRIAAVKFVVYGDGTAGTPLWQEVQNVQLDQQGRYEVMLGANTSGGVPVDLFTSGEPRWLGVQILAPGSEEEPRILMVSVPYALEAADSQTLGGLPPSAFMKATQATAGETTTSSTTVLAATAANSYIPAITLPGGSPLPGYASTGGVPTASVTASGATPGAVPKFANGSTLVNSQINDLSGVVTMQNLSNVLFADQFTGGVPDAVNACPANGCVIYAYSPQANRNLGTIDPGTKSITIYLGPYVYTVKQITLEKGMKIIGMGQSGGSNGTPTCSVALPCNGTTLQSINGNNPVFVIPQMNNMPIIGVELSGFLLLGSAGNTSEDGFFIDASSYTNYGLWFSNISSVSISGFAGVGLHLRARNNDFASSNQWLLFNNLSVQRNPGGGNALRLEGSVFELRFRNCQFDGQTMGDGTNIYIGGYGGGLSGYPASIVFEGLVSQRAGTAVQIDGGINLLFYGSHHELLWGGYQVSNNTNIGTKGLTIADSYFSGNVGVNSGGGYDLNVATTNAEGVVFEHNHILGTPDSILKSTNLASVVYQDNLSYSPSVGLPPTSGMTTQMSPATTINIQGVHSIGLNPSSTPITTVQSGLGPGEMVTFYTLGGQVTFASGGNIDLMGMPSLTVNGTITFVRTDLGGLLWKVVSQWSPSSSTTSTAQFRGNADASLESSANLMELAKSH